MPKRLIAVFFLGAGLAQADECGDIAAQFARDRHSLSIGQLDTLMACAGDLMRDKAQGLPGRTTEASAPVSQPLTRSPLTNAAIDTAAP